MKKKSLSKSVLFSGIRSILTILFPFITYKYAVFILGVDNIGRVEYAKSVVSYFILFAGLGINAYAARNSAAIRDDKIKLQKFSNLVFGVNCVSTFFSLVLLFVITFFVQSFRNEFILILVFSLQIVLSTIGVEWLYIAFEDFEYITIRTIICQVMAMLFMFVFVNNANDLVMYAFTLVIASYGAHLFAFLYSKKYCKIIPKLSKQSLKILPEILVLFANSLAVTIYVNSDITMLGLLSGSYAIGIYSAAVKIYSAAKTLISSIMNVILPRFTYYIHNDKENELIKYENKIIKVLITLGLPFVAGLVCESKNMLLLVSGQEYIQATSTMQILAIAILFSTVGMFIGSTILLPQKKEKKILKATITGALINIILNFLLLGKISYLGAAITTLISEIVVSSMQCIAAGDILKKIKIEKKDFLPPIIGVISVVFICYCVEQLRIIYILKLVISVAVSLLVYLLILIATKNILFLNIANTIMSKLRRKS